MVLKQVVREVDRLLAWWSVVKGTLTTEARLNKAIADLFGSVAEEVMDRLNAQRLSSVAGREKIAQPIEQLQNKLHGEMSSAARDAARAGYSSAGQGLGLTDKIPFSVLERLDKRVAEAAAQSIDSITSEVIDILKTGYDDGLGIDAMADRLQEKLGTLSDSRAEMIARTEVNSAQNFGNHEVIDDLADYRQWITAEDDRVRDGTTGDADHASMHGEIVRAGDPYSNGLMYPGDPSGDEGEVINCRCTEVAFILPEGFTAPDGDEPFFEDELVEFPAGEAQQ